MEIARCRFPLAGGGTDRAWGIYFSFGFGPEQRAERNANTRMQWESQAQRGTNLETVIR